MLLAKEPICREHGLEGHAVDQTNSFIGFHPAFSGLIAILGTVIAHLVGLVGSTVTVTLERSKARFQLGRRTMSCGP
jgi:hypothetical protein